MNDLNQIYRRMAIGWGPEQLAPHYRAAERHGASIGRRDPEPTRPIPLLAAAMPPAAGLSVAIHLLHALPNVAQTRLPTQLLETAERNGAGVLHRAQRALELDGAAHGYTVEEWLPIVFDIAGPLMQSARADIEPPSIVRETQQAISWLSRAVVELDEDSAEVPSALAEVLARLLVTWVFTTLALDGATPP